MTPRTEAETVRRVVERVEWLDPNTFHGWTDADVPTVGKCESVGWIIREDDEGIVLATSRGPDGYLCPLFIPHGAIVTRAAYATDTREGR